MRSLRTLYLALVLAAPAGAQTATPPSCVARATSVTPSVPAVVPIDVSNNHVFVKVCAGGRELDFILDTGAGTSFFDLGMARRLGLKFGASFSARGAGAGTVAGARIDGGSLALAGTDIKHPVGAAIDLSRLPSREGHRMDGILGFDFISRFVVAIDYVKQELRLYDRDGFRYDGAGVSIPVTFISNHPHVNAEVRLLDGATITGRMVVDVGAAASLSLAKPWVDANNLRARVGPTVRRRGGGGVGGATSFEMGRVASLRLGSIEISRPVTSLYGDSAGVFTEQGSWVGNMGGEILRRFTPFLDYKNKRIILEPHAGTDEPFEADMSGVGLVMDDSLTTIIVDNVMPDSPASVAGLQPRDTIVAIDEQPGTAGAMRSLRKRLRREGERVTLTVRRGGDTKTVTLITRRLV